MELYLFKSIGNTRWMRMRHERFCQLYRYYSEASRKCYWGGRLLKRLVSHSSTRSKEKRISPGQQRLPWAWDIRHS